MIILLNTITRSDNSFICDIIDTDKLPKNIKLFFESLPNGFRITNTDDEVDIIGESFDVSDYCDNMKMPLCLFGKNAKIDKIVNMDY
jgi:hypothetical protein